ncbi:MAG: hypothetical protein IJM39_07660 [Firmicutes bacterium]|nr:hypothetical protein [Bacillota bacterium]
MTDSVLTSEYTGLGGPDAAGLDDLLGSALSQGVPEDVLRGVTPWKKAMKLVFAGLVLSLIGIDIYNIDLAVNIAGNILCILGFRRLRRENWSFMVCSVLSSLAAAVNISRLVINCMGRRLELVRLVYDRLAGGVLMALMIATLVFFLAALKLVEKKSGIPLGMGFAKNVLIWYVVIRAMMFWYGYRQAQGVLPGHMFVFCVFLSAAIALCLHALYRLAKELEDPGYAIKASDPKVPDIAVIAALVAISVALFAGSFATRNYPDSWKEYTPDANASAITEELSKAPVLKFADPDNSGAQTPRKSGDTLEFEPADPVPAELLSMLTADELKHLQGSSRIYLIADQYSEERTYSVYAFVNGDEVWQLISFAWKNAPKASGSEAIAVTTTDKEDAFSGRMFCSIDGRPSVSEYYIPAGGRANYTAQDHSKSGQEGSTGHSGSTGSSDRTNSSGRSDRTGNSNTPSEIININEMLNIHYGGAGVDLAGFTIPRGAEDLRGYVLQKRVLEKDKLYSGLLMSYTHRTTDFMFPMHTAAEGYVSGTDQFSLAKRPFETDHFGTMAAYWYLPDLP